jgi:hypothetical protein
MYIFGGLVVDVHFPAGFQENKVILYNVLISPIYQPHALRFIFSFVSSP